jgi:hypothetical protein
VYHPIPITVNTPKTINVLGSGLEIVGGGPPRAVWAKTTEAAVSGKINAARLFMLSLSTSVLNDEGRLDSRTHVF